VKKIKEHFRKNWLIYISIMILIEIILILLFIKKGAITWP